MKTALIATITFGHIPNLLETALEGVADAATTNANIDQIIVDDASGRAPEIVHGVRVVTTPVRGGYAATVNWIVKMYGDDYERLVLVNPDASPSKEAVEQLASAKSSLAVPLVENAAGDVENIRTIATGYARVHSLLFSERFSVSSNRSTFADEAVPDNFDSPPFVPAGSVVSFAMSELRELPLDPDMFWIEMSDWVQRRSRRKGPLNVEVMDVRIAHTGASTSVSYPLSVAASQLNADVHYVRRYGNLISRALLPLAVAVRSARYAVKRGSLRGGVFMFRVGAFGQDWRVLA